MILDDDTTCNLKKKMFLHDSFNQKEVRNVLVDVCKKHDVVYSTLSDRSMSHVVTREAEERVAPETVVLHILQWLGEGCRGLPVRESSAAEFSPASLDVQVFREPLIKYAVANVQVSGSIAGIKKGHVEYITGLHFYEVAERASLKEFEPELVTLETPRRDAAFVDSMVTEELYPVDASGRASNEDLFYECAESVDSQLLTDLSLLAISGRRLRGFHVDEDPVPAFPTVAELLKGKKVWFVYERSQTAVRHLVRRGWTLHEVMDEAQVYSL